MKNILLIVGLIVCTVSFAQYDVGVYCDEGPKGIGAYQWYNLINECPQTKLHFIDGEDVRAGALDKLDMLIMPGGSSGDEYQSLKEEGMEKLRTYIRNGGGYIGTCAGCFLLLDQDRLPKGKRMHAIPYRYVDCPSGTLYLNHRFTEAGKAAFGITNDTWVVRFHGGPVMLPSMNEIEGAKFESWAKYASDADTRKPITDANRTSGYDAILGGTYGKGRVVVFGAHPEYFVGSVALVDAAMRWVLQDSSVTTVRHYRKPGAKPVAVVTVPMGTKEVASAMVALNACPEYDVFPIDQDTIWFNELEHVDLVVFMSGKARFSKKDAAVIFDGFVKAGGKAIVHEKGADILAEVAAALADSSAR